MGNINGPENLFLAHIKNKSMNGLIRYVAQVAFAGITAVCAQAQTVNELQTSYINALGGKEKLLELKDVFIETNMEVMGIQLPAKQWIVYDEASRQEVEFQGQKMITFIGKDRGWIINPLMGAQKATPIPDAAVKAAQGTLTRGSELTDYQERGLTATYNGKDTVNGIAAYKIVLNKDNYESILYLDPGSYYVIRNIVKTKVDQQPVEQITNFSDYRKTPEGFVYPYSTVTSNPMTGDIKLSASKIEVNIAPDIKELESTN
jgi:hypothetical protein